MFSMIQFMSDVVAQDTTFSKFGRFKGSSLDPLITLLQVGAFGPAQKDAIRIEIAKIPRDKQIKYRQALNYAVQQLGLTEIRQIPYAIPWDATMTFDRYAVSPCGYGAQYIPIGRYHHVFRLRWTSSNGDMQSLANVGTRENVQFLSNPAGPPFNFVQAGTPMQFIWGQNATGANTGYNDDDHQTVLPSIICASPRVIGQVVAQQQYEYSTDGGTTWHDMPGGAFLLTKGVRAGGTGFVYYLSKANWAPLNTKPYHFEVEYDVGPPPAVMPIPGMKMQKGVSTTASLPTYGRLLYPG